LEAIAPPFPRNSFPPKSKKQKLMMLMIRSSNK
jgi:hypothetical protein